MLAAFDVPDPDLAELVFLLLRNTEVQAITCATIQRLVVPMDYTDVMREYRTRDAAFRAVRGEFMMALGEVDQTVYEAFGLTDAEREHVERRLSTFPLVRLQPRYPWDAVRPRPIRAYTEDRFR